jgi:MoaA/NifB/PqqE/SkfB family radical SAM enzyme
MSRARGDMSLVLFKKIIDSFEKDEIKKINLWNFGEPLLNKDIFEMVRYAAKKGIRTIISTNSTMLDREIRKNILCSGLDTIIVCLDGMKKESHEKYRVGSNFEDIVNNIKALASEKKNSASKTKIRLQMLLTKENGKEINKLKEFAKSLGVDELALKDISLGSWNNDKEKLAKEWLPEDKKYSRYEDYNTLKIKRKSEKCTWCKRNGTILWNGDVTICCYDFDGKHIFTNVLKEDFRKVLLSDKMTKIRNKIANRQYEKCKECQETEFGMEVMRL